ncbi:MAG TPA: tetratricopeptide repeat protein, partial [Vicinamibacteria bacterium]
TQAALQIAVDSGNVRSQANELSMMGWSLGKQGLVDASIECCQRAVDMLRGGALSNELATALANLAGVLLDAGRYDDAIANAQESLRTDSESINLRNWNSGFLARAHLGKDDLVQARAAAEVGCASDEPENLPNVSTLLGIVCLRQGKREAAADAFRAALGQAEALIQFAPNHNALDAKGVALSGLALCEGSASNAAAESHRAARARNRDDGVVRRVQWLYDALAPADPDGLLAAARRWDTSGG